ncbi:MAG: DoxX family protein [Acidimicrobiia bacterium]|nr:DoxX family protein [Acidimicrobiia bacterium]
MLAVQENERQRVGMVRTQASATMPVIHAAFCVRWGHGLVPAGCGSANLGAGATTLDPPFRAGPAGHRAEVHDRGRAGRESRHSPDRASGARVRRGRRLSRICAQMEGDDLWARGTVGPGARREVAATGLGRCGRRRWVDRTVHGRHAAVVVQFRGWGWLELLQRRHRTSAADARAPRKRHHCDRRAAPAHDQLRRRGAMVYQVAPRVHARRTVPPDRSDRRFARPAWAASIHHAHHRGGCVLQVAPELPDRTRKAMAMNRLTWVLQGVLAVVFLAHGALFLFPPAEAAAQMEAFLPQWFQVFLGVAEVAAAVGLTVPAWTGIQPWLVPASAIGIMIVMVAATVLHVVRHESVSAIITTILLGASTLVAYVRWRRLPFPPGSMTRSRSVGA